MGTLWASDGQKYVSGAVPSVRTTSGWNPGRYVWRHNGTTWVQVWSRDTTPPVAPTVTAGIVAGTKNVLDITVKTPTDRITRTVVKVGVNKWSTGPLTSDGTYYAQKSSSGEEWSEWWKGAAASSHPLTGTKRIPASYQTFTFPLDTPINISAYVQDEFFNWSPAGTRTVRTAKGDPPPPTLKTVSAYINCSDSHTWNNVGSNWSSTAASNGYLYQGGGYNQQGMWFHGDNIRAALAPAAAINTVNVLIQRVNDGHGTSGAATVRVGLHGHTSRPAGAPGPLNVPTDAVALNRGQAVWWQTPSYWWEGFQSGANRGMGISYQTTGYTDPRYVVVYGRGTNSGQVYLEWRQY